MTRELDRPLDQLKEEALRRYDELATAVRLTLDRAAAWGASLIEVKARMPHVYRDTSKTLVQFADLSDSELIELTTEGTPAGDSPEGDATPG